MRVRVYHLVATGALLVAFLAGTAWAYYAGHGSGSALFDVGQPSASASTCIPLAGTSATASALPAGAIPTATSTYDSNACTIAFAFGIPRGDTGAQGPKGDAGPTGPAGPQGLQGIPGTNGTNGTPGTNGTSATTSSIGSGCANGGIVVHSASPDVSVCNGTNGTNGSPGSNGQSVTVVSEPAGGNCANAGQKLTDFSGTQYVCNGTNGTPGATGPQGPTGASWFGNVTGFSGTTFSSTATPTPVACASGSTILGGGVNTTGTVRASYPSDSTHWTVVLASAASGSVYAICAQGTAPGFVIQTGTNGSGTTRSVTCPASAPKLIGGGVNGGTSNVLASYPSASDTWTATVNTNAPTNVYAICTSG